jgi:hypothetical protein
MTGELWLIPCMTRGPPGSASLRWALPKITDSPSLVEKDRRVPLGFRVAAVKGE